MPAPAERQQQLHGAGGNGRSHIGLEAQLPDPQIGGGHQLRQLPILLKNFLHFGQPHCPRLRQPDAAPVPAQKNEAVFFLQRA
mgnify:CR=1 FL=1